LFGGDDGVIRYWVAGYGNVTADGCR
jgi:hypothetical protein